MSDFLYFRTRKRGILFVQVLASPFPLRSFALVEVLDEQFASFFLALRTVPIFAAKLTPIPDINLIPLASAILAAENRRRALPFRRLLRS